MFYTYFQTRFAMFAVPPSTNMESTKMGQAAGWDAAEGRLHNGGCITPSKADTILRLIKMGTSQKVPFFKENKHPHEALRCPDALL